MFFNGKYNSKSFWNTTQFVSSLNIYIQLTNYVLHIEILRDWDLFVYFQEFNLINDQNDYQNLVIEIFWWRKIALIGGR